MPRIHSYNTDGERTVGAYYAGGGVDRGIPTPIFKHVAIFGFRQSFLGPKLRKGFRSFLLRNDGATTVYIEAIEFVGINHLHMSGGGLTKSAALSGVFLPKRHASQHTTYWTCADFSTRLVMPYTVAASLRMSEDFVGIAIWRDLPKSDTELFGQDALFVMRQGTQLLIRDYNNGAGTDTVVAGMFPAGPSEKEFHFSLAAGTLSVYLDNVLSATATVAHRSGYAGLLAAKSALLICNGFYYSGNVKGPY